MSSAGENMDVDTSSTNSAAVPQSATTEHDAIRVIRPRETIGNHRSEQEPPKLTLKLRNLAPITANALDGEVSTATINTPTGVRNPGSMMSGVTGKPPIQQEAPLQWAHATPSTDALKPPAKPVRWLGSANNPIDVDTLKTPSPHRFLDRPSSYFAPLPLQYRPSRPKLVSKYFTPNGAAILSGVINGHQSHDIYRMLAARKDIPTPPGFTLVKSRIGTAVPPFRTYTAPPGTQGPRSYEHANNQPNYQPYPTNVLQQPSRAHHPYTTFYQTPTNGYSIFPKQDETLLRERAVQFVLDHSRPRPRKRRLSDDPDETSSSEYENAATTTKRARKGTRTPTKTPDLSAARTPSTGASEENMFDRNLKLTEMVQHAQLVTSLLMTYPYSTDQKGLREDIAMLAAVTDKQLEAWLSAENELDLETRKRRRIFSATTPTPSPRKSPAKRGAPGTHARTQSEVIMLTEDMRKQREEQEMRKQEDELKRYLSAESDVWEKRIEKGIKGGYTSSLANSGVAGLSNEGLLSSHLGLPDPAQVGDVQGPEHTGEEEQALVREEVPVASP